MLSNNSTIQGCLGAGNKIVSISVVTMSCGSLPICLRHPAATHRRRNSAAGAQIHQEDVMKSKFVVSLFAFLVVLAGVAQAQDHSKVDIFAGYSYDRWDGAKKFNLNGGSA